MQQEKCKCFKYVTKNNLNQDNSAGIVMGLQLDGKGSIPSTAKRLFSIPQCPERL
jgi:hypothetical protein